MKCECREDGCFHGKHKYDNFAFVTVKSGKKIISMCMTCATLSGKDTEEMEIEN